MSIDWLNGKISIRNVAIKAVMDQISDMRNKFQWISFSRIFREQDSRADSLSKAGVSLEAWLINVQEDRDGVITTTPLFQFL